MKRILFVILAFAALCVCVPAFAQSRGGASRGARGGAADFDPSAVSVTLRVAYWTKPEGKDAQKLYIKSGHEYHILPVLEMAFQYSIDYRGTVPIPVYRKATEAEMAAQKDAGVKKADIGFIPLFSINPRDMRDIGVILLPGKLENKPAGEVLIFDWSDKAFPYGSVRIGNFCKRRLMGLLKPQDEPQGETFALGPGKFFTSSPVKGNSRIYELQLAALVKKEPQIVYSSAARFYGNARTILFIVPKAGVPQPKDGVPVLDFRSIQEYKPAEHAPKAAPDKAGRRGNDKADKADKADKKQDKQQDRRQQQQQRR